VTEVWIATVLEQKIMNPITTILIVFFTLLLTACGGGGSPASGTDAVDPDAGDGSGDGSGVSPDPIPGAITNINFGSGTSDNFIPGAITLSNSYSLLAGSLQVSVDVVDSDNANTTVAQAYQFEFSSTCSVKTPAEASFSVAKIGSSSGGAATTYRNINCRDSDTITVNLLSQDGSQRLASATAVVPAYVPQLGFGSGAEYIDKKISGETILLNSPSSLLTANAVDVASINKLISDENYTAIWRSSCSASNFSVISQTLSSGNLVTRYDANSCVGVDIVTLTIYATNNLQVALDSISTSIQNGPVIDNTATPALSELTISNDYVLAGGSLEVLVKGVDSNDGSPLVGDYKYQFISSCADGTSEFESMLVVASSGAVSNRLKNKNCVTSGDSTLTVNLFEAGADVESDAPLSVISTVFKTAYPKLGFGSGADFVAGKIEGVTNLIDEASTKLAVNSVDVLNLNSLINSDNYVAQWSAECEEATFSVESQSLSTPNVVTRYDANDCVGSDTVMVKVFAKNNLNTELNRASLKLTIGSAAGVDVDAKLSDLELSGNHALAGESLVLNIRGIDLKYEEELLNENSQNELLTDNYVYVFESTCAQTSFDNASIQSKTGEIVNTYYNKQCGASGASSTDTLSVKLYAASDLEFTTVLDSKSITINTSYPRLGFGTGADFVMGKVEGITNLIDEASTLLTVNVVDDLNLNSLIESDNYIAQWSAVCPTASFSITSQSLSTSNVVTRYDVNDCASNDTVTVKLFAKDDLTTALDSISVPISIADTANVGVVPKLGSGSGSDFNLGQLSLSANYALAGGDLVVAVNGVNSLDSNSLLEETYLYKFASTCATGSTRFSSDVVTSATGIVTNTYFNQTCEGGDTITVSLYPASGVTATALATASATFDTAMPKLGFGKGADFVDGQLSGNTNLIDEASTKLSASVIDPLDVNNPLISVDYYIQWSSPCTTDSFSIESQNLISAISTRYDGDPDTASCKESVVKLTLYNKFNDELDSISTKIIIGEGLEAVEPVIGTVVQGTFVEGVLGIAESDKEITVKQNISMSVKIVDITKNYAALTGDEYTVVFDSICAKGGRAEFDTLGIPDSEGVVDAVYRPLGCRGQDEISVKLHSVKDGGTILSLVQSSITITEPLVNTIEFTDMTARQIAMKGISYTSLPETTAVSFVVRDEYNDPISGEEIEFSLSNSSVGATLAGQPVDGVITSTTDAEGNVTAYVNSGSAHGLVAVLAVIKSDPTKRTQSFNISITTGLPVQSAFSIAASNYHPQGWDKNGTPVTIEVNLDDHFKNPVPDGTQVNFVTDGGQIEPFCLTGGGLCTVVWTSYDTRPGFGIDNINIEQRSRLPHPANDSTSSHYCPGCVKDDPTWNGGRSGVVTILAYTEGEVGFADGNGASGEANGRFDDGEYFSKMSEAYLDANENGQYDVPDGNNPFEKLIEYDASGGYTPLVDVPDFYQGGTCTDAARALGHCQNLVHIRRSLQLVMSSDLVDIKLDSVAGAKDTDTGIAKDFSNSSCINLSEDGPITFNYKISDFNGNVPMKAMLLNFSALGYEVEDMPGAVRSLTTGLTSAYPVSVTIDADYAAVDGGYVRLYSIMADGQVSGNSGRSMKVTDDPSINISTDDYILDVSDESGPVDGGGAPTNKQIVSFKFRDACDIAPAAGDIIVVRTEGVSVAMYEKDAVITADPVTNVKTTAAIPVSKNPRFQIFGNQLTLDNPASDDDESGYMRVLVEKLPPVIGEDPVEEGTLDITIYKRTTGVGYSVITQKIQL